MLSGKPYTSPGPRFREMKGRLSTQIALRIIDHIRQNELPKGHHLPAQELADLFKVSRAPVKFFGREVFLPNGPFVLSLVSETPIYPLFIIRTGYRKYKIVAREPIVCSRGGGSRDEVIAEAMQRWAQVLEEILKSHWQQWFAFTPLW